MHGDEVTVDETVVRRLLAGQVPQWADLPLEPVEPRGTDNWLYRLGEELVVRLPCRERTVATLVRERTWLPRLTGRLPLEIPLPVAAGEPETRDIFCSQLSMDDATWARARGWAVCQAVGALAYYTPETYTSLVGEARRWLADAL
jgi:aminoglycoside phosphotransferase (APT) family kinase protein